jgi:hypothetical protein
MTIKIEHQTLLRVLERQQANAPLLDSTISHINNERFVLLDFHKPLGNDISVEKLRGLSTDDDDTLSTSSLSTEDSTDDSCEIERRVSFAEDLVSDEWTRPYTPKEEISALFYSTEETSR